MRNTVLSTLRALGLLGLATVAIAGCNAGMAPEGDTREEAQARFQAMSPEEQIKFIEGSPMPGPEKEKRIKEIKDKAGIK